MHLVLLTLLAAVDEAPADATGRLHELLAREWQARLEESPLFATSVGDDRYDDRLPSMTPEDLARRDARWRGFLAEIDAIDPEALGEADRISRGMLRDQLQDRIAGYRLGDWQIPLNADSGFHTAFAQLPQEMPLRTVAGYENYLARLKGAPAYFGQMIDLMRIGLRRGMTLPRVVLEGIDGTISPHVVEDPSASVFWKPFASFPATVPASEHARLRREGAAAIQDAVVPAYGALLRFMAGEYVPGARDSVGASALPDGPAYYRQQVRHYTTLDLAPEEIHEIGLREVERIRAEMAEVIRQVGFQGTFGAFLELLRSDPRFYARTAEELLTRAAWIVKRMDGKLPALFGRLPRQPYTVEPVPDHIAPKYTAGRYVGAPLGGTQPGRYWVNTYALDTRPLYNLEALSLHEAVPGHHLQIALAKEQEGLPEFRRHAYLSAFGEGWGLYSEWLGIEAGFYTDPYSNFGRLTYEMWRACRLVVDTGVHAKGWTRQQMIDYLASRTALSLHEVRTETDRYISWPGQALAYKIGELKIRELRRRAEQALGERFDVREFHDAVLRNGSVPLTVLEQTIDAYIRGAARPARAAPAPE
jgi:uncharacterized protein (DUF885 family)